MTMPETSPRARRRPAVVGSRPLSPTPAPWTRSAPSWWQPSRAWGPSRAGGTSPRAAPCATGRRCESATNKVHHVDQHASNSRDRDDQICPLIVAEVLLFLRHHRTQARTVTEDGPGLLGWSLVLMRGAVPLRGLGPYAEVDTARLPLNHPQRGKCLAELPLTVVSRAEPQGFRLLAAPSNSQIFRRYESALSLTGRNTLPRSLCW